MDHYVGHFELAETQDVLDVLGLPLFHVAGLGRDFDQTFEFEAGENFVLRRFLDAEDSQDPTRRRIEQPVQRIEHDERDMERIGNPLRHRPRFADRQRLGHLLAKHNVQRREHQKADQERREMQRRVWHAERLEDGLQNARHRRLTDPAETERGHRDAELAARQIGFDIAHHLLQKSGAEAIFFRHGVDAEAAALHQREFRRHVERVGGQQQKGNQQIDDGVAHPASRSVRKARISAGSTSPATKA